MPFFLWRFLFAPETQENTTLLDEQQQQQLAQKTLYTGYEAWAAGQWVGESTFLRWRAALAVAAGLTLAYQVRSVLQGHLDESWAEACRALRGASRHCIKTGRSGTLKLTEDELNQVRYSLERARVKGPVLLPLVALQLLSVCALLITLPLLLSRIGGLGGLGVCRAAKEALSVVGLRVSAAAAAAPATERTGQLSEGLLAAVEHFAGGSDLGASLKRAMKELAGELAALAAPVFWRPILSYLTLVALLVWFLQVELALAYWRVYGGPTEEGEDEEEEVAEIAARKVTEGKKKNK